MASNKNQETDHKIGQENWATSILLQTDTGSCMKEQPNISGIKYNLGAAIEAQKGILLDYGS